MSKPVSTKMLVLVMVLPFVMAPVVMAKALDRATVVHFETISVEQGLSDDSVYAILQDQTGFIWLATSDGLCRYDGYRLTVYRHDPTDPNSLAHNRVYTLHQSIDGMIWIGYEGGGLGRFDPATGLFSTYRIRVPGQSQVTSASLGASAGHDVVRAIVEAGEGRLLIGTDAGLFWFDRATKTFQQQSLGEAIHPVRALYRDEEGLIWCGLVGGGLVRLDPMRGGTFVYGQVDGLSGDTVYSITGLKDALWLGMGDGLQRFDADGFTDFPALDTGLSPGKIYALVPGEGNELWVGSFGGGLNLFDVGTGEVSVFRHDKTDQKSLGDNKIRCLLFDRTGILWAGTTAGGVSRLDPQTRLLNHYTHRPLLPEILSDKNVTIIITDRFEDEIFWIGTRDGLNRFDSSAERSRIFRHASGNPYSLSSNEIYGLYQDSEGMIWAGVMYALNRLDPKTGLVRRFVSDPDNPATLSSGDVWSIHEDAKGRFWVGTWDAGLNLFDRETGTAERLPFGQGEGTLSHQAVMHIVSSPDGMLWLATFGGGLNLLNPETRVFTSYLHQPDQPAAGPAHNVLNTILEDQHHLLWIGSMGGLSRFDPKENRFRHYTRQDGLPNDHVIALVEDDLGYIWAATNQGLSRFDPATESFRNLTVSDGLQSNVFSRAGARTTDGRLLFGGKNGFNLFNPTSIQPDLMAPLTVLSDLRVFDQTAFHGEGAEPPKPIEKTSRVTFDHRQKQFSLEFAGLHFADPQGLRYAYMLDGFDADWMFVPASKRFATYTSLDSGKYTFRVKAANKDGLWGPETHLAIEILAPPWRTWWAYSIYIFAVIGLVFLVERYRLARKRRLKSQNDALAQKNAELETFEDIVRTINREVSRDKLLAVLLDQSIRIMPKVDRGAFLVWNEELARYRVHGSVGYEASIKGQLLTYDEVFHPYVQYLEPFGPGIFLIENLKDKIEKLPGLDARAPSSMMAMVVRLENPVHHGFVNWQNMEDPKAFADVDPRKLERFRAHAVSAMEKAQLLEDLRNKNEEILKTRDQLLMQEKMASIGTMTTGVAHEIRNPLNFINNFAGISIDLIDEIQENLRKAGEESKEDIEEGLEDLAANTSIILKHGRKAENIIQGMIELADSGTGDWEPTSINRLIEEFAQMTVRGFQAKNGDFGLQVAYQFAAGLPHFHIQPRGISRVIVNLVTNALEALFDRREQDSEDYRPVLTIGTTLEDGFLQVRIVDNGSGVPSARHDQIFNPFFTTKSPDKGNIGLGLAIAYDIVVKDHQGTIELLPESGYTAFVIRLPIEKVGVVDHVEQAAFQQ